MVSNFIEDYWGVEMNIFNVYIKFGCYLNLVIWLRFKVFFFIIFNL